MSIFQQLLCPHKLLEFVKTLWSSPPQYVYRCRSCGRQFTLKGR